MCALDHSYSQLENVLWLFFKCLPNFITVITIIMYVYMNRCVYAWHGVPVEAQRPSLWQQFSPPTLAWVTGRNSHDECLYLLDRLAT